jgi:LacI family transcriptional regulator
MSKAHPRHRRRVTSKDIARVAGVSQTTVSFVLNNKYPEKVSEATRARVLKAMEDLDYRPDIIAQSMKTRRTKTIGVIVENIASTIFAYAVRGVEVALDEEDYNLIICDSYGKSEREEASAELLLQKNVDGFIFVSSSRKLKNDTINYLIELSVPCVLVNRWFDEELLEPCFSIVLDNEGASHRAVEHLVNKGKTRIAFLGGGIVSGLKYKCALERYAGYKKGLEAFGLPFDPELAEVGAPDFSTYDHGYKMACQVLEKTRVDGIYAIHDNMAIGAARAARDLGYNIPDDVAIVGFGNTPQGYYVEPKLTTVHIPFHEAGIMAAKLLLSYLNGENPREHTQVKECYVIERESS